MIAPVRAIARILIWGYIFGDNTSVASEKLGYHSEVNSYLPVTDSS